jgi:hypothetical protein
MKTLIAAVAFATVFAAPAFAQYCNSWVWGSWQCKGAVAAPASANFAYAASFNDRRSALSDRRSERSGRRAPVRDCNPVRHWANWRSCS